MMAGIMDPSMTVRESKGAAAQMRAGMEQQSQDAFERVIKSGMYTRPMVTKDSDLEAGDRVEPEVRPHGRDRRHERTLRRRPARRAGEDQRAPRW